MNATPSENELKLTNEVSDLKKELEELKTAMKM